MAMFFCSFNRDKIVVIGVKSVYVHVYVHAEFVLKILSHHFGGLIP